MAMNSLCRSDGRSGLTSGADGSGGNVTAVPVAGALGAPQRAVVRRGARRVVAATITYNVVEGVVAIGAGMGASSAALVGFGLDSTIEVASAMAVAWQFAATDPEARERTALRIIAVSFFALAAY